MNEITITQNKQIQSIDFSNEKIELIKATVAKDATNLELQFFIEQCKRTQLDPVTRQIYFIKDKQGKVNIQTSIDGLRLIAERSDKYEGQTSPQWCGQDGAWKDVWLNKTPPAACKVGVYKKGFRDALYAIAVFDEYAQKTKDYKTGDEKLNYIWGSKPALMLAKVAEALALRKAFPNDMSGIYTVDEYTPEVAQKPITISQPVIEKTAAVDIKANAMVKYPENTVEAVEPVDSDFDNFNGQVPTQIDEYRIGFGKYKGQIIQAIDLNELEGYVNYLRNYSEKNNKPMSQEVLDFIYQVERLKNKSK